MTEYADARIACTDTGVRIRGYYFPWGTKAIPYGAIRGFERFTMTGLRGKGRIWGSGDFRHWANFDPSRPKKDVGFFIDVGRWAIPFVTPDDPDRFEAVITERTGHRPSGAGPGA